MVRTQSTMLPLGTPAPAFTLPAPAEGRTYSLSDFAGKKATVIVFMCNHCPYVKHVAEALAQLSAEYMAQGVAFVGISSNDAGQYPDDGPEKMAEEAKFRGYRFPYLYDETQEVARAYRAACTPDFFVFDEDHKLVYRGQMDDSRPKSDIPVTGKDLRAALDAALAGTTVPAEEQMPSLGCNIKWRSGQEPGYFNPAGTA